MVQDRTIIPLLLDQADPYPHMELYHLFTPARAHTATEQLRAHPRRLTMDNIPLLLKSPTLMHSYSSSLDIFPAKQREPFTRKALRNCTISSSNTRTRNPKSKRCWSRQALHSESISTGRWQVVRRRTRSGMSLLPTRYLVSD